MVKNTYVALLFSIGIGGDRRLIMSDWRSMMEEIGLRNPRTLIATGNAIFESACASVGELEVLLEDAFERRFGRRVDTIVRGIKSVIVWKDPGIPRIGSGIMLATQTGTCLDS